MALSLEYGLGISKWIVAVCILAFVVYIVAGGAHRILSASEKIVPIKVGLFVIATCIILAYHFKAIIPTLQLIISSAFSPWAVAGGLIGFTVQQAMSAGIVKITMASEAGLGTTAIIFGGTGSKEPVKDAIMSMLSTFITTIFAFTTALSIVVSGVWNNGQTSTALTMTAYQTVFGSLGSWIVSFLSLSFGLGCIVAYAYVARETWIFLTNGKLLWLFGVLYCGIAFWGCVAQVDMVWTAVNLFTFGLLVINLYGIVYLLPVIRKALAEFSKRQA